MPTLKRRWTADDIADLPADGNRYEIIDGELYVTPAPSLWHQRVVGEIYARLRDYFVLEPIGEVVFAPADVVFSATRSVQPDLFVLPLDHGRRAGRFEDVGRLVLAVEIVSPSTARGDRVSKRRLFRDEGVPEYWVVDLDSRTIERSTPADARVDVIADRLRWHPEHATLPFELDVADVFASALDD